MSVKSAHNDNTHPELEMWLRIALDSAWPGIAERPKIEGDALLIPQAYYHDWQFRELKSVEWVTVRSREDLIKALGFGPLFD